MKKYPNVDAFRNDDKQRVVLWCGGVVNTYKSNILAEVFFSEIMHDGKLSNKLDICRVPVTELDFIKIGRVWKGKEYNQDNFLNLEVHEFNFDLNIHPPESIRYKDIQWNNMYNIGNIASVYHDNLYSSRLTKITSNLGIDVLIPSLEYLTGAIVPEHKGFRRQLLQSNIDIFTSKYIVEAREIGKKYGVRLKEGHYPKNMTFLAYLKLNKKTRNRLSKIWPSMEIAELMPNGNEHAFRHPIILPCHPDNMSLSGEGIMINYNTFLMMRIKAVSDMNTYPIIKLEQKYKYKTNDEKKNSTSNTVINSVEYKLEDGQLVTGEHNPHASNGHVMIRSEVSRIGEPTIIEVESERVEINTSEHREVLQDKKSAQLSSGTKDGNKDSEETMKLKQGENKNSDVKTYMGSDTVIKNAIQELEDMLRDNKINGFSYIDNNAVEHTNVVFCSISKKLLPAEYNGRWNIKKTVIIDDIKKYQLRKFLLVKIELKSNHSIYLLEIERKSKSEFLSGILFIMHNSISVNQILDLLKAIVLNHGSFTKQINKNSKEKKNVSLPVKNYMHFRHVKTDSNLLYKEIEKAQNKDIV